MKHYEKTRMTTRGRSCALERRLRRSESGNARRIVAALLAVVAVLAKPVGVIADSTGEMSPTATSGSFSSASNAFACDGMVAQATANNQEQTYSVHGLSVPADANITGIRVRVRANDGTRNNRKIRVRLSWDGGATFTTGGGTGILSTRNFHKSSPLRDYIVGGPSVLWGRTWLPSELSDANFQVRLQARLPGSPGDPINLDCVPVTVFYFIPGAPNLNLAKSDSPDPVMPEQQLSYTITYSNTGESTATNVVITDVTPANTTFVSASPAPVSAPSVGGTGAVTWNVGTLPVGGTGAATLVVKVAPSLTNGTQISNENYTIESDQNSATAGSTVVTTVQGTIALGLAKSASPDPVAPGETLTYVLTVSNTGNATSTNIIVDEGYDGNVSSPLLASTTCTGLIANVDVDQFTVPSLSAGGSCTITITTTVDSALANGVLLANFAEIIDDAGNFAEATVVTTVMNPAVCGDGVVTLPEQCDQGIANGSTESCCTAACTLRDSGQICRAAADECDTSETCDGANPACPVDGFVSAGDACADDDNECTDDECNGSGQCTHLNNSAPCDDLLYCNGADMCGGGSCSVHAGDPCTTGGECNDACNETADDCAVAAGTSCGDDGNECTDDECDGLGQCIHPNNTAPCDDDSPCSVNDTCDGGTCQGTSLECGDGNFAPACSEECDDGNTTNGDGCSATCMLEPCGPEPEASCLQPAQGKKAVLIVKDGSPNDRDRLTWKWSKGAATSKGDFGDPTMDSDYQLCIYRDSTPRLLMSARAPAGGTCAGVPCWSAKRSGFKYKDEDLTPDGIGLILLKAGEAERAKILVKGRGENLPVPDLATFDSAITIQLKDLKTGKCWGAIYSPPAIKSTHQKFKDKAD